MSSRFYRTLYVKDQVDALLRIWGCDKSVTPPARGKVVHVAFPPGDTFVRAEIHYTNQKSTYGKRLYECRMFT